MGNLDQDDIFLKGVEEIASTENSRRILNRLCKVTSNIFFLKYLEVQKILSLQKMPRLSNDLENIRRMSLSYERLQLYEALKELTLDSQQHIFSMFSINNKKKKQRIAEMVWESNDFVDSSAKVIYVIYFFDDPSKSFKEDCLSSNNNFFKSFTLNRMSRKGKKLFNMN